MNKSLSVKLNICVILIMVAGIMAFCSLGVFAASVPAATGQIDSSVGVNLRRSASTGSDVITVLTDDTTVKIHREVFKKKTSTSSSNIWYYVTANGQKGYVRSDLVDNIRYGSVKGRIASSVTYRKGAGTTMKAAGIFDTGAKVTVVLKARPVKSARGSSKTWYKIKKGGKYYYVCSTRVELSKTITYPQAGEPAQTGTQSSYIQPPSPKMTDEEFEKYLTKQGFPERYKKKLCKLHRKHPNWGFVAYSTGIKWSDALAKQTKGSRSLVSRIYPSSYRDGSRQYESGWYKADSRVVAYYMDPRNFLNEESIYMFEDLTYKPAYQTKSVVAAILSPTKLPKCGFKAKLFVNAAKESNVSPVFLASRARQETGSGGDAVNGSKVLGRKVYNPFNIGAYGSNPLYNGLVYAYAKGWTTPAKSVKGGAAELAGRYINQGQNTGYYQKFNVRNGVSKMGTHQYMTNIMAPYSEAHITMTSYSKLGITNESLGFVIPVYNNMPGRTNLP